MTLASTVPVGRWVVVWVAWDSVFDLFNPDNAETTFALHDSVGNVYSNIGACTNRADFFASGAWAGLFIGQITEQLESGDTLTVHATHAGLLIAKSMSAHEFDPGVDGDGNPMRWALTQGGHFFHEDRANDPAGMNFDLDVEREWLELHVLGAEGPNTDAYTWDSNWTQIAGDGTTGGAADSNVHVRGGYRIATEDALAVDVASTTADRDYSQVVTAVTAIPPTIFPETPVLDDMNRADEYPMDAGLWNLTDTAYGSGLGEIKSNRMVGAGGSHFLEVWKNCQEVYATLAEYSGEPHIHVLTNGNAALANMTGVGFAYVLQSFGQPTVDDCVFFGRSGFQGSVQRGHVIIWMDGADGIKWGFKVTKKGGTGRFIIRAWFDRGSGWEEIAALMLPFFVFISGTGAIAARDNDVSAQDDFGGGMIPCGKRFIPQIYRRQFGVA